MSTLIIVHPERGYTRPALGDRAERRASRRILDKIAREMKRFINADRSVYVLGEHSQSSSSQFLYYRTRDLAHHHPAHVTFIPQPFFGPAYEMQFLLTKEHLVNEGTTSATVCGIARDICVNIMYHLLHGALPQCVKMSDYRDAASRLGWSQQRLQEIFQHTIESRIDESLSR